MMYMHEPQKDMRTVIDSRCFAPRAASARDARSQWRMWQKYVNQADGGPYLHNTQ